MIISSSVCVKYVLPCPGYYKYYSAALNIGMHLSFQIMIFSGYMARSGIAGSCGEGNGTPLQYSCLENPMDGGAW